MLSSLPQELILYLGTFLSNDSLNILIRTQKLFAQLLTPQLYNDEIRFRREQTYGLYSHDLPLQCLGCTHRWQSDVILDYFRTRPAHFLTNADKHDRSLLHIVARHGNPKLAEILLSKGLDINIRGTFGRTPLQEAAKYNEQTMLEWFLDAGADARAADNDGNSVLLETALHCPAAMVQRVIEAIKQQQQWSVSQFTESDIFSPSTAQHVLQAAIYHGDEVSVRLLLDNGADASSADGYGTTALTSAIMYKHIKIAHLLLDRDADVIPFDNFSRSALTCAADNHSDWSIVQRLFQKIKEAGGDIDAESAVGFGMRPLHYFARQGYLSAVEVLIDNNADVLARSEAGMTALHLALYCYPESPIRYEKVCILLIEAITRVNPHYDHVLPSPVPLSGGTALHLAAQQGSETLVRMLIDREVDVLALDDNGRSASHVARLFDHDDISELLRQEMDSRQHRSSVLLPAHNLGQSIRST